MHTMTAILALIAVLTTGLYFICLAVLSFSAPARASRFLHGFASSALTHYIELFLRLVVGAAFLVRGPSMLFSRVFVAFGWILVVTTAVLVLVPWKWHNSFAQKSVPHAVRYLPLVAIASLVLGGLIIAAALGGSGSNIR